MQINCWFAALIFFSTIRVVKLLPVEEKNKMKYILQWTNPDTDPFFRMGKGNRPFEKRWCRNKNCFITSNTNVLEIIEDFDAILFYGPEFCQKHVSFPSERSNHQKYVFVSRETPAYYPLDSERYDGFFNWTYTYKLDSDIYFGFVIIRNKDGEIIGPKKDMHWMDAKDMKAIDSEFRKKLRSKKFTAAWFVSNCDTNSGREEIALELQKELYIRGLVLDIYSDNCKWNGIKSCPKDLELNSAGPECLRIIEENYYFYLAFENSLSEDYVTEKLLHAVQHRAVPIVYGGANYTRFLPEGSYLDAKKLTMRELVDKIIMAILDKDIYYDFFKWTNHYYYEGIDETPETDYMCTLCSALNNDFRMRQISVYENMRKWWK